MNPASRKRILMLVENSAYPRDDRLRRESRALRDAGYQVSVICPASDGQPGYECFEGIYVYRYPAPPDAMGFIGYLWEYGYSMVATCILVWRVLLTKGFDILHAAHPPDTYGLLAAGFKLLGKKFVMDHHDLAPELYFARFEGKGNPLVHRVLLGLEWLSYRLADHVIATNESYRIVEMERGHLAPEQITIVRNGPDLNELRWDGPETLKTENEKIVLGYVGVIGVQDGMDYLLRALHHLVYDLGRSDFSCVILGKGDALNSSRLLAQELGLSDYVLFTGWINQQAEVARYLSTMDICLAPEPSDPYNDRSTAAKVMEYMALRKPVVAFDLPEHRFTAQNAAVYARPNDEVDYARQISLLMDDRNRRQAMGQAGRHRIETDLAWQHQAKALIYAYHCLTSSEIHYEG